MMNCFFRYISYAFDHQMMFLIQVVFIFLKNLASGNWGGGAIDRSSGKRPSNLTVGATTFLIEIVICCYGKNRRSQCQLPFQLNNSMQVTAVIKYKALFGEPLPQISLSL